MIFYLVVTESIIFEGWCKQVNLTTLLFAKLFFHLVSLFSIHSIRNRLKQVSPIFSSHFIVLFNSKIGPLHKLNCFFNYYLLKWFNRSCILYLLISLYRHNIDITVLILILYLLYTYVFLLLLLRNTQSGLYGLLSYSAVRTLCVGSLSWHMMHSNVYFWWCNLPWQHMLHRSTNTRLSISWYNEEQVLKHLNRFFIPSIMF